MVYYYSTCSNHILSFKSALKGGGYTSGGGGGSGRLVWLWCLAFGAFLLLAHGARGQDDVKIGYENENNVNNS